MDTIQDLADKCLTRSESISNYLNLETYLEEESVYLLKDGSMAVAYEVALSQHETLTGAEIELLLGKLKVFLQFGERDTVQFIFEQSEIAGLISPTIVQTTENTYFPSKLKALEDRRLLDSKPFERKLIITVRRLPEKDSISAKLLKATKEWNSPNVTLEVEISDAIRNARDFNRDLSNIETGSPLPLKRMEPEFLCKYLRGIFNPITIHEREFAPINKKRPLHEQIVFNSAELFFYGLKRENHSSHILSMKGAPPFCYPGSMAYFLSLDFPFRLTVNISFPNEFEIKRHFGLKDFFLQNTPSARSRRQKTEIEALQERLLVDDHVVNMTFTLGFDSVTPEEKRERTKLARTVFNHFLETETIEETEIGFGLFINSLPFQYHPISDYTGRRSIRILASDLTNFLPVFGPFTGLISGVSLLKTRDGGMAPFSLKPSGISHHTTVLGDTGSGKSAQVISLLLGEWTRDPKPMVFVIDSKTSYFGVSKVVPSEITLFDSGSQLPFSPFDGAFTDEKIRFLVGFLSSAMTLTSQDFRIQSEHRSVLTEAIKLAYIRKSKSAKMALVDGALVESNSEQPILITIDDVIAAMGTLPSIESFQGFDNTISQITKKLRPFFGDGIYSKFFRGSLSSHSKTNLDLYVFDLDGLSLDPILQSLVTMCVIDRIREMVRSQSGASRGGFIVIEELGMLGRTNPEASIFVIDAAETFRKLGFFLIGLTPNPRNYFDTEVGRAMWAVSDHYLLLSMKPDNVDFIAKQSNILDEATIQIAKSLETRRGKYADLLYVSKDGKNKGVVRIAATPERLWLIPTHAPDKKVFNETLNIFKGDIHEALNDLASKYPFGTTEGCLS